MLKTKENYVIGVSQEVVNEIIDIVGNVDIFEGNLMDNYIFWDTNNVNIDGYDSREYIIVKEVYVNCWTSKLEAILTDDLELVEEYYDTWEEENNNY